MNTASLLIPSPRAAVYAARRTARLAATAPAIGQIVTVRGTTCRITRVHPMGTLDVLSECGKYAFRVSGLSF